MLGWFAPKCPVGTWEKTWTEYRMRWLADQFGIERLLRAHVVVPSKQLFAVTTDSEVEDVRRLLEVICGYMGVKPASVRLDLCQDELMPGAAGQWAKREKSIIRVAYSQLADRERLLATLAHELAHELLLGRGLLTGEESDHEWVTDLLPVFLGVGLFAANATLRESHERTAQWYSWQVSRQGYLPSHVIGYAMAVFAFLRGESDPEWARHLRADAAEPLRNGLRYLRKTNDSLIRPDMVGGKRPALTPEEAVQWLRRGTASVRLATLWDLRERPLSEPEVVTAVAERLRDGDAAIPRQAALTLAAFGDAADSAVPALVDVLVIADEPTRAGVAEAFGRLRLRAEVAVPELCSLLSDSHPGVLEAAAGALIQFGVRAEQAAPRLLPRLLVAVRDGDEDLARLLAEALIVTAADPLGQARRELAGADQELARRVVRKLEKRLRRTPPSGG
jgi:hypothetical protein